MPVALTVLTVVCPAIAITLDILAGRIRPSPVRHSTLLSVLELIRRRKQLCVTFLHQPRAPKQEEASFGAQDYLRSTHHLIVVSCGLFDLGESIKRAIISKDLLVSLQYKGDSSAFLSEVTLLLNSQRYRRQETPYRSG
jgi:hypothetical protein